MDSGPYRVIAASVTSRPSAARGTGAFCVAEWRRLAAFYGVIALLHVVGWGLYLHHAPLHPGLVGLGLIAYLLGLRHAFDADHIAAVDDTVRLIMHQGRRPLGTGFFFSLGHSTIVLLLSVAVASAAASVAQDLPGLRHLGGWIGASLSGTFLWVIGLLNVRVLLDVLKVVRSARTGPHTHGHLEELPARRGLLDRMLGRRMRQLVTHSWHMYPLGLLFGLGFDTASEIALLAMTAGAAGGDLPVAAVLALPILFAAGMSAMDTTDGVLMVMVYDWAFVNPLRKIFYNLAITCLSIAVALVIGSVELAQVLVGALDLGGPAARFVTGLDFGDMGYAIVALFVVAWLASVAIWRFGRPGGARHAREGPGEAASHSHPHTHDSGSRHSHRDFHSIRPSPEQALAAPAQSRARGARAGPVAGNGAPDGS
jgi:high-affinity nickel-transport protein